MKVLFSAEDFLDKFLRLSAMRSGVGVGFMYLNLSLVLISCRVIISIFSYSSTMQWAPWGLLGRPRLQTLSATSQSHLNIGEPREP